MLQQHSVGAAMLQWLLSVTKVLGYVFVLLVHYYLLVSCCMIPLPSLGPMCATCVKWVGPLICLERRSSELQEQRTTVTTACKLTQHTADNSNDSLQTHATHSVQQWQHPVETADGVACTHADIKHNSRTTVSAVTTPQLQPQALFHVSRIHVHVSRKFDFFFETLLQMEDQTVLINMIQQSSATKRVVSHAPNKVWLTLN